MADDDGPPGETRSQSSARDADGMRNAPQDQAQSISGHNGDEDAGQDCASAAPDDHKSDEATSHQATGQSSVAVDSEEDKLAALDNVHGNGEEKPTALEALTAEVASIRRVLEGATSDAADDVRLQLRAWEHRIVRNDHRQDDVTTRTRLISMTAPTGQNILQGTDDCVRVVSFDDGVYRGQVKPFRLETPSSETDVVQTRWLPHGWGILTSHQGLRRVGQWRDGDQVGVGSLQSAVLLYDGEWHAATGPSGYGIGTFAFGATFIGCWHNGKPYGLGRLQLFDTNRVSYGWFYGLQCLQPVVTENIEELHNSSLKSLLPTLRYDDQPQRGLFRVGEILEDARLSALRFALDQWRRAACDHVLELARRRRAEAMTSWIEAQAAQQDAIAWHLSNEIHAYRERMATVLNDVAAGRQHYARVQRIREFHSNKLSSAIFQRDLARRCVVSQEESISIMENELAEVQHLLDEATNAQAECERLAGQQHAVKRQIENVTVKINGLRQNLRQQEENDEQPQQGMSRKDLATPATPSYAKAVHGPRQMLPPPSGEMDSELPFVCDVPGCSCGIPRHVFTRVAAALNGE